eukprot:scaffold3822_cov379-Prasinococcus_capsulatus_cf.AAC.9
MSERSLLSAFGDSRDSCTRMAGIFTYPFLCKKALREQLFYVSVLEQGLFLQSGQFEFQATHIVLRVVQFHLHLPASGGDLPEVLHPDMARTFSAHIPGWRAAVMAGTLAGAAAAVATTCPAGESTGCVAPAGAFCVVGTPCSSEAPAAKPIGTGVLVEGPAASSAVVTTGSCSGSTTARPPHQLSSTAFSAGESDILASPAWPPPLPQSAGWPTPCARGPQRVLGGPSRGSVARRVARRTTYAPHVLPQLARTLTKRSSPGSLPRNAAPSRGRHGRVCCAPASPRRKLCSAAALGEGGGQRKEGQDEEERKQASAHARTHATDAAQRHAQQQRNATQRNATGGARQGSAWLGLASLAHAAVLPHPFRDRQSVGGGGGLREAPGRHISSQIAPSEAPFGRLWGPFRAFGATARGGATICSGKTGAGPRAGAGCRTHPC